MNQEQNKIYSKLLSKFKFNVAQKNQIKEGIEKNLDISWYANPEFNKDQMVQIRLGLEEKLDVSIYAKTEFNAWQIWKN